MNAFDDSWVNVLMGVTVGLLVWCVDTLAQPAKPMFPIAHQPALTHEHTVQGDLVVDGDLMVNGDVLITGSLTVLNDDIDDDARVCRGR